MKRLATALAVPALAAALLAAPAQAAPEDYGLAEVEASLSTTQAGAHPDLTVTFELNQDPASEPNLFGLREGYAATKDLSFELPPGLAGDPNAFGVPQQCTAQELATSLIPGGGCPNGSQLGLTRIFAYSFVIPLTEPLYMMQPPGGETVARLAFIAGLHPTYIDFELRSESDYGLTSKIRSTTSLVTLIRAENTFWGVPADPVHDTERMTPNEALEGFNGSPPRPPGSRQLPFMTSPTTCGKPLPFTASATSWPLPDQVSTLTTELGTITGCDRLTFNPDVTVEPTTRHAAAPTGMDITLRVPAPDGADVMESSHIRDIRIDLPEGLAINPGTADGMQVCSAADVGLGIRKASHCPDAAKLAATEFDIPLLPRRMKGAIYLRQPEPGNLFRIWVVADDLGAHVKLPGELEVDRETGRVNSVILDLPQFPVREVKLLFKSGFRAPLANPPACGTYFTDWEFTPWSGNRPASGSSPMTIDRGCDTGGFDPQLSAGATSPAAGRPSPFVLGLTRQDGEQNVAALGVTLPPGLLAKPKGVALCEGAAAASGECPSASRVGTLTAAVGSGPAPLWIPQPGKDPTAVYLAGPYRGAPISFVVKVPAQAGPFDLGTVVTRAAIHLDPRTAQATVKTDPLPQILEGVPITYRTIHVDIDRPDFTQNPTNCSELSVNAAVTSDAGTIANPSSRFKVGGCRGLGFRPRLHMRLSGGTKRGGHPKFRAVLRARKGDANISRAAITLPRSAFLDQAHIRTVCTRVQFAADACPKGAIYGRAVVKTPLLDTPLRGPVYLRSSNNLLPDLVADLRGPESLPVRVELVGRVDSVRGAIRATFAAVPDVPVSKFVLAMQGGKKGLIVNSRNLCRGTFRARAKLNAHNGRRRTLRPKLRASCGKKRKAKRSTRRPARSIRDVR